MSSRVVSGIHHVTAIAGEPQGNLDFYTQVLGLRLVKLTVNFDDPGTYHFYFGDRDGSPGSILTFFPWPQARSGAVGNGQVTATTFAVPSQSAEYWRHRLDAAGVDVADLGERFGERVLAFADPDGMPLEIIASAHTTGGRGWNSTSVDPAHAVAGFHSATLSVETLEPTAQLLTGVLGWEQVGQDGQRVRFRAPSVSGARQPGDVVDVLSRPEHSFGRMGVGVVHHIAWRTRDDAEQVAWRQDLVARGYGVSPVMDRTYFHSIYFREPGGVLFEIATDPPGFARDEAPDHLGERLMLPPGVEPLRAALEEKLPRLRLPVRSHE